MPRKEVTLKREAGIDQFVRNRAHQINAAQII